MINIAQILSECPKNTKLYSPIFGNVYLYSTSPNYLVISVTLNEGGKSLEQFLCDGKYTQMGECMLFPSKEQRDWSKFQIPFKDGDIIYTKHKLGTEFVSIFQREYERDIITYWDINLSTNKLIGSLHEGNAFKVFIEKDKIKEQRIATEEEKQKLFKAFKDNGYTWNTETKTLEKLIQSKFKVGDKVRHKNNHNVVVTITNIEEDYYACGTNKAFWFTEQDDYELIHEPKFKVGDRVKQIGSPRSYIIRSVEFDRYILHNNQFIRFKDEHIYELVNKFDITTLKPFDKVLVRDNSSGRWDITFYELYDNTNSCYPHRTLGGNIYKYCIPYEGNEHLLGKTDDCPDFYKNW